MALAERLADVAAPVPILLIPRSPVAATDGLRLAARGIDVFDASALDIDALARRFLLHAHAWTREERGRRAHALLKSQEALIAGLVHDLRTPLMAINLSAEVASVRSPEEVVQQAMRRIRSSTQRMARALDHVSNVARRDAQIPRDAREAADLGRLARAAPSTRFAASTLPPSSTSWSTATCACMRTPRRCNGHWRTCFRRPPRMRRATASACASTAPPRTGSGSR